MLVPAIGTVAAQDFAYAAAPAAVDDPENTAPVAWLAAECTSAVWGADCTAAAEAGQAAQVAQSGLEPEVVAAAAAVQIAHALGEVAAAGVVSGHEESFDPVAAAHKAGVSAAEAHSDYDTAKAKEADAVAKVVDPDSPVRRSWGLPLAWCM